MKPLVILLLFLTSCVSTRPELASAVIRFAEEPRMGLPGSIASIDGNEIEDHPTSVIYLAGKRSITYRCPDTIIMDRLPTLQIDLEPGRIYELICIGGTATVRVK